MSMINKKQLVNVALLSALTVGAFALGPQEISAEEGYVPISRIEGKDRYETAALISNETYASADTVVIANAMNFADALSGVPLAYQNDAPILLAHGTKLKASIISEIERLGATKVIILGGEAAVSSEIAQQLKALGLTTERLAGDNRFETSALIADELTSTKASDTAVVVDGMEFADAMSIAPIAAREGMPIYLTRTNSLSNADDLNGYTSTYIVGGENAVSKTVESSLNDVTRLHGLDRYETNRDVIKHFGIRSSDLYVATGLNFADALSGSVLAAKNNSTVALVKGDVHSILIGYLNSYPVDAFTILGGEAAVSNKVAHTLNSYLDRDVGEDEGGNFSPVEDETENDVPALPTASSSFVFNDEDRTVTITIVANEMAEGLAYISIPDGSEVTKSVATFTVKDTAIYDFYIYDNANNFIVESVRIEMPAEPEPEIVVDDTIDTSLPVLPSAEISSRYVEYDHSEILTIAVNATQGGFSHVVNPDGTQSDSPVYEYKVTETNEYSFYVHDTLGNVTEVLFLVELPVVEDGAVDDGQWDEEPVVEDEVVVNDALVIPERYADAVLIAPSSEIQAIVDTVNGATDYGTMYYDSANKVHRYEMWVDAETVAMFGWNETEAMAYVTHINEQLIQAFYGDYTYINDYIQYDDFTNGVGTFTVFPGSAKE